MKRYAKVLFILLLFFGVTGAEAADRIRVGVLRFESKADGISGQEAEIITDLFTRELIQSKTIQVFERVQLEQIGEEINLGMSGLVDINTAVEVGRVAGLQYILLGSVTELSQKASGGGIAFIGSAAHEARATIDMRVIDTATTEVVMALSATGNSKSEGTAIAIGGFAFAEAEFGGIEARAIADAVAQLGHKVRSELGGESSHVLRADGSEYLIDVSAKPGALYLVYIDGKSILGMDGRQIGKEKIPLAVLKVRDAGSGHSTCVLAQGCKGDLIRRGDKVEPIAPAAAKSLVSGKRFAANRPPASSGTFEQIFGGDPQPGAVSPTPSPAPITETTSAPRAQPAEDSAQTQPNRPVQTQPVSVSIDGFDPNRSSDSKVIDTYPLSPAERNNLGIMQRGAYSMYKNKKYKDAYEAFIKATEAYSGHYLAAYWAGMTAQKLKKNDEARQWFDKALSINPSYQPASDAKSKMK